MAFTYLSNTRWFVNWFQTTLPKPDLIKASIGVQIPPHQVHDLIYTQACQFMDMCSIFSQSPSSEAMFQIPIMSP